MSGAQVLIAEDFAPLRGLRVGLITNHTGTVVTPRGVRSTIDVLHESTALDLVALFGVEHGIRGEAEAGVQISSDVDAATGLPVHSLYGQTNRPTAEMLRGIDALVFDIQDVGVRYYTYAWSMVHALRAAAENHVKFVVLDRPDPIGGVLVQGSILEPALSSLVGLEPVPMRYGMTIGELARFANTEYGIGADLVVVPMRGWRRTMWFDDTGLPWRAPSPNMPSLESAAHYAGTCLFEGTNLSAGRGTPLAFQQIGAPWLDNTAVAAALARRGLPGVRIEPVTFTPEKPGDGKYPSTEVRGLRFTVTDRSTYDPTVTAIAALVEIRKLHPDSLQFRAAHFDRLAGNPRIRPQILDGMDVNAITGGWREANAAFDARRRP
ncbi:MAG TPA: DUF1343 domain-containing protein, partial [Longimicrobiales bacterium]